ncbi:putative mitochondrial rho gtpase protein [Eutypa lata UCREL1]|uniref:Mitochondrial Rho GTPase 1 n=1 Tax=Eutypa lata (strain UCR-EL1) TaxID=1287681 RepID=M7SKV3_EUTLA|nr:putative mitochondrial rho gtpase protein [Eutypa lata UCREL1]
MSTVRVCVCGDEGTGKSSLIASFVKDVFISNKIQSVLPQITIPPSIGTPEGVTTTIVDTSARPQDRTTLRKEIRKSNVILLVYSDHYSYERVALFWMPYFRSLGVNVPVVLCANKSDLATATSSPQVFEEEMLPVMNEFREIDSCIRASAKEHRNVNETFFLCQKAVTHPIAPLYDYKEGNLKPACISALKRVFYLCDKDQDGYLNDQEMHSFQAKCFEKPLTSEDLENIKLTVSKAVPGTDTDKGVDMRGFLQLNKIYAEKGRHETIWIILRKHRYTDSLSLEDSFIRPKFDVPEYSSAELSPAGYRVELHGGKQCYLILEELGELEPAILENQAKLDSCDLICYAYDSSDPDSFSHIVDLRKRFPQLDDLPAVYTALKADKDKTTQRCELQPDQYTSSLMMSTPLHVSVKWNSIGELFVALAEAATNPSTAFPKSEEPPPDRTGLYLALGATTCAGVAAFMIWRRSTNSP